MTASSRATAGSALTRRTVLRLMALGATGVVAACATSAAPGAPAASSPLATAPKTRWGMTEAEEAAWQQIEAAARKEGTLTYYSNGNIPQSEADKLAAAWNQDYPDIKLQYLLAGSSAQVRTRIATEQAAKSYVADAFDTSAPSALQLPPELRQTFTPPVLKDRSIKFGASPEGLNSGFWVPNALQVLAFWTNKNLVKPGDEPKTYMDVVTNPRWKGQITWQAPWAAGGGLHISYYCKQAYGMDWITKMQAQAPVGAANQDAALLQVARGEYALGIGLYGKQASQLLRNGEPLSAKWPEDVTIAISVGLCLANNAPHPNAGKVFLNWIAAEGGQKFMSSLGQFPAREDLPLPEAWMQGYNKAPKKFEFLVDEPTQTAAQKEFEGYFKR